MSKALVVSDSMAVTKQQIDVAELLIAGYDVPTISRESAVPVATIKKWLRDDDSFRNLLAKFTDAVIEEIKTDLVVASRKSLRKMSTLMDSKDEDMQYQAANNIMNRTPWLTAAKKTSVDVTQTTTVFSNMSEDDLLSFIRLGDSEVIDVEYSEREAGAGGAGSAGASEAKE